MTEAKADPPAAAAANRVPTVRPSDARPPLGADISKEPVFTPMTTPPELANRGEVGDALEDHYPPLLRNAGIGGKAVVFVFIDETGVVRNTKVSRSSGYPALDQAAIRIASVMRFSAARNRTKDVPVWVEIPIIFTPE